MFAALLMFFSTMASEFHTFYFLLKNILLYRWGECFKIEKS